MENLAANNHSITWLQVFNNSKVNGAPYRGDYLPAHSWEWPTDTYLQRRLLILRAHAGSETKMGTPAGKEKRQDQHICRPAHVLDPVLERRDPLVDKPKKSRNLRRNLRAVGAMKQRRRSS